MSGDVGGHAEGGRIVSGLPISRANGDNRLITAKTGEVILNEEQQARAGGSPFFRALGVPGFATGGVVGMPPSYNSYIQQQVTNQIDMEAITEAVKSGIKESSEVMANAVKQGAELGTERGSQSGIRDLNTDLDIARNAIF